MYTYVYRSMYVYILRYVYYAPHLLIVSFIFLLQDNVSPHDNEAMISHEDYEDCNDDPDYNLSDNSEDSESSYNENTCNASGGSTNNIERNITSSSLETSKYIDDGNDICDDTDLIVPKSQKKGSKKYFCIYCKKLQTKFARHLETVHKDEADVKKFLLLPKGKISNKIIYTILINLCPIYIIVLLRKFFYHF